MLVVVTNVFEGCCVRMTTLLVTHNRGLKNVGRRSNMKSPTAAVSAEDFFLVASSAICDECNTVNTERTNRRETEQNNTKSLVALAYLFKHLGYVYINS